MRVLQLATILAAGLLVPASAFASICPTTGSTNTDCAFILTIGSGGTVTGSAAGAGGERGVKLIAQDKDLQCWLQFRS